MHDADRGKFPVEEILRDISPGLAVGDAHKGLFRTAGGVAVDEHHRLAAIQHLVEDRAVDRAQERDAAHHLGPHLQQVFVLDGRVLPRVAEDHHQPPLAQRGLHRGGDGGHVRVGGVGNQQRHDPALPAAQRAACARRAVAQRVDHRPDPAHGVGGGLVLDAVHDPRDCGGRHPGLPRHRLDRRRVLSPPAGAARTGIRIGTGHRIPVVHGSPPC